jgi:4'-phosphopantetheinyl transferase
MNRVSPDIRAGELHVWIADLDAGEKNGARTRRQAQLSVEERARAARFFNRRDGERWACSRALLRLLLGSYLSTDSAELRFQLGEHGKPRLARGADSVGASTIDGAELHFNLSHSGGFGLYVFALDCEVGVDIETPGRNIDVLAISQRALGQEEAEQLRLLDEGQREREFLRAWVRHEARLKCLGLGLGAPARGRARECWTVEVDVDEPAVAAVAAEHTPARVERRRWSFAGSEHVSDQAGGVSSALSTARGTSGSALAAAERRRIRMMPRG